MPGMAAKTKGFLILLAMVVLLALPQYSAALTLEQAKDQGLVGETTSGYLGAVAAVPGADVIALVQDINAKRRSLYQQIAKENGTPLQAVEQLAAKKAITKTTPGHFLQAADGQWLRK